MEWQEFGEDRVDQDLSPLDPSYLRGILLAVLQRDEYVERIATELHFEPIREELGAQARSLVRLTDLRLAASFEPKDVTSLKRELESDLRSLTRPITLSGVYRWKWDLLQATEHKKDPEPDFQDSKFVRVSFAAAAILLFVDLDVPGIETMSSPRLRKRIGKLAEIVRALSKSLDTQVGKLESLVANRAPHRPRTPDQKLLDALFDYRMGHDPRRVAEDLGIIPYRSSPSATCGTDYGGTRGWKRRLEDKLQRGAKVEAEKYPAAAAVFADQDNPQMQETARIAYRAHEEISELQPVEPAWSIVGNILDLDPSQPEDLEVIKAYVQLGSCLEQGLDPLPTYADFNT